MSELIEQCKLLVNGKRCVLVAGHRGGCVEPEYRRDMSDIIRYRFLSDRYEEEKEMVSEQRTEIEVLRTARDIMMTALEKISHSPCYDPGEGGCIGENKCPRCTAKEAMGDARKALHK